MKGSFWCKFFTQYNHRPSQYAQTENLGVVLMVVNSPTSNCGACRTLKKPILRLQTLKTFIPNSNPIVPQENNDPDAPRVM